jgi:hypothetical protein
LGRGGAASRQPGRASPDHNDIEGVHVAAFRFGRSRRARGCDGRARFGQDVQSYIEGWTNYYGQFYQTRLRSTLKRIDVYVIRWARQKYKRLRHKTKGARDCSLTGSYVMATAEHREPYESRGLRTILGAHGGEIPPRDSSAASGER